MTLGNRGLYVNLDHWLEDLELHHGPPTDIKLDVSVPDSLVLLPMDVMRGTYFQSKCRVESKEYLSAKDIIIFMEVIKKSKMKK